MKKRMLLLVLLFVISILFSETLLIYKTDGTILQFEEENIFNLTFDDIVNESIQINKTNATMDEIEIALIEDIEFTETPTERMLINKTDGTTYEIETVFIAYISFGEITSIDDASELISTIPIRYLRNFPNPFNPETTISFELNESGFTKIEIFNIKGEIINTILEQALSVGSHNIEWNGIDSSGNNSSSGVYFYKISVNGKQKTNKMLLLK